MTTHTLTDSDAPKVIAVVGPTASGKSELAVRLAKKYNGEILSVDSRQIYRGMDLGTGKVEGIIKKDSDGNIMSVYKGVVHYGIDIISPKTAYSVARFQKYAKKIISAMVRRGKIPILCGGTAHWMDAVLHDQQLPEVKPNPALRTKLEKKSTESLFKELSRKDPARAQNIDPHNRRRLIRALEIISATGKPVPHPVSHSPYHILWIGIAAEPEILQKRIRTRLTERVNGGMVKEIERLKQYGVSWKVLWNFGLEYRYMSEYMRGIRSFDETMHVLGTAINQYAKRQMTWWKRNKDIQWVKNYQAAAQLTAAYLKNKA